MLRLFIYHFFALLFSYKYIYIYIFAFNSARYLSSAIWLVRFDFVQEAEGPKSFKKYTYNTEIQDRNRK